ncbi:MAG: hypothetical protein PHY93_18725 [Bacteriovorax sp.]|nr:hypothetical protein [Bacteriovorax sp.]
MKSIFNFLFLFFICGIANAEDVQVKKIGLYKILIDRPNDQDEGRIRIYQRGKLVFEEREFGSYYYLGNRFDGSLKAKDPYSGKDLNGNSIPDLIITQWTGGAHCCHYLTVFELGHKFRKLITVSGGSSGFGISDLDGDKIPEIEFWDWPIDYAFTSYAESAQGKTILKFEKNNYRVSQKLMTTSVPTAKKINTFQSEIKNAFKKEKSNFPYTFLSAMMDLSYSGHLDLAFKIADKTWPVERPGLSEFKLEFKNLLNNSPYWKEFTSN